MPLTANGPNSGDGRLRRKAGTFHAPGLPGMPRRPLRTTGNGLEGESSIRMRGLSRSPRRFAFDDSRGRPPIPPPTVQLSVANPGIVQSASRPGTPLDNAVAEPFFKTLKRELAEGRSYGTRDEAKQDIFKYIELYCSRVRMHSTLDYMPPVEYERQYA